MVDSFQLCFEYGEKKLLLPRLAVGLGAPQTIIRRPLPSPDRHNKLVNAVCSCRQSLWNIPVMSVQLSSLCLCHNFNFHTAIFDCIVDYMFITFSQISKDVQVFFHFFETTFLPFLFQLYHGNQMIPSWRICIWRSTSVQHVQV